MNPQETETDIGSELPKSFEKYDNITKESVIKYINHLNPIEKQAYTIGKSHLGTSFNILKSNGYTEWKKNN
jgi:hypothetical protein